VESAILGREISSCSHRARKIGSINRMATTHALAEKRPGSPRGIEPIDLGPTCSEVTAPLPPLLGQLSQDPFPVMADIGGDNPGPPRNTADLGCYRESEARNVLLEHCRSPSQQARGSIQASTAERI